MKIKKKKPTQLSTLSHTHDTAPQRDSCTHHTPLHHSKVHESGFLSSLAVAINYPINHYQPLPLSCYTTPCVSLIWLEGSALSSLFCHSLSEPPAIHAAIRKICWWILKSSISRSSKYEAGATGELRMGMGFELPAPGAKGGLFFVCVGSRKLT